MSDLDNLLNTVVQDETQAAIHQNQNPWIPSAFGVDMSRSLLSLKSHNDAQGTDNRGYSEEELEFPYDKADPNIIRQATEDSLDTDTEEDEDSDEESEERNQELKSAIFRMARYTKPPTSRTNKKPIVPMKPLARIPEADFGDNWRGSGGQEKPALLTPDYDTEQTFDFGQAKPDTTSRWTDRKVSSSARRKNGKETSADIEMTSFSGPARGKVGFSNNVTTIPSSFRQEYDPLTLPDLTKLPELTLDAITDCIAKRYKHDLIYTRCGDILISVNPFKPLELCSYKYFKGYTENSISDTPHLFAVSAQAYQGIRRQHQNQVILVSGESGSGKTEATKLIVRHLIHIAGDEYETLQDRIIQINPLLEAFGNAQTKLNRNSSRFAKLLTLNVNANGKIESARVKDYMLEKSRVIHHAQGERTFHAFYALLVGASDRLLESLYIRRYDWFRVTGEFSATSERENLLYRTIYKLMQDVFKLIKLTEDEIQDVHTILAAILHLGNIEFLESDNDSVVIKDERLVHKVATLLQLDVEQLTKALIERVGRMGKDQKTLYEVKGPQRRSSQDSSSLFKTPSRGEIIELSKNLKQADDERDAAAKSLYERLFGWLVRKINDSLRAFRVPASIGILDICGFENLNKNSFEQLCINLVNEQLQNFMNKAVIEDERVLYIEEGLEIGDLDIEGINNDAILHMFMEKKSGIMAMIDEESKFEISNNDLLVTKLAATFGNNGIFIPSVSNAPEFKIRHFAGEVAYDARSFIQKNRDTLSENMKECFRASESILVQDLFFVEKSETGSISTANYHFRESKKPNTKLQKPFTEVNLSRTINRSIRATLQQKFGDNRPTFQSGDLAQRSTHIKYFRNSMSELLNAMKEAFPFFVRCIKPNGHDIPGELSLERVKTQLQYNGVKEIARIRTYNFPIRLSKETFKKIYGDLADKNSKSDLFHDILHIVGADPSQYKVGITQIFMKEPVKTALDSALSELQEKQRREQHQREIERMQEIQQMEALKRMTTGEFNLWQHPAEQLKRELGEAMNDADDIMHIPSIPLETIVETSTPASFQDGSVYNRASSSSNEIQTTEESDEESSSIQSVEEESKPATPTAAWDITQEITEEEERLDVHEQPVLMVIKTIVYILLCVVILGSFVIQKVSFVLLTSTLKDHHQGSNPKDNIREEKLQKVIILFLVIAICIPYALGFIYALAKICFGNFKRPSFGTWIWVFIVENLHAVGLCLLVFRILPNLDVIRSAMLLSATAIFPAVLKVTMSSTDYVIKGTLCVSCDSQGPGKKFLSYVADILAMLLQISVIPLIIIMNYFSDEKGVFQLLSDTWYILEIVGTFLLVSCAYWENFTDGNLFCQLSVKNWFKNAVLKIRYDLENSRYYPHLISYLCKIGLTFLMGYLLNDDLSFESAFNALKDRKDPIKAEAISAIIALIVSAFVAFYASFGACMFQMQVVSLTIPAVLAVPVTIGILYTNCEFNYLTFLKHHITNPDTDAIKCLGTSADMDAGKHFYHFLFGAAWWISLIILCRYMWRPKVDRTANMSRLFINPSYCGILTSESIMLNRIRNPSRVKKIPQVSADGEMKTYYYKLGGKLNEDDDDDSDDEDKAPVDEKGMPDDEKGMPDDKKAEESPTVPMLYACATMWHETRTEMVQLLKSLHRLDRDQFIRRLVNEKVEGHDPDFYNFEAHIFFDDAMEPDDNDEQVPNNWVKELVACMDIACSSVHEKPMKVHPPYKVPTPYGGQLIWQMPGENLLFVHMKDIKKIRNRKRWSQVMYMYYLLGYRHIMAAKHEVLEKMKEFATMKGSHGLNINEINYQLGENMALKAQNTFLLALDGDTDFSPGSIKILLDRMKDDKVGAACGRIHPIGNGPMVWYQKFEYAIGHWLQKAAEHVFGCVLCSPGCFSLFRAAALMDTNVMKKYTTEPTEPGHHLQYDQGEDRWLCTLLLQQGYRIEYAAAADAWTFAPEGFFEFFNQRRRWMPSTIANILDLLGSASATTKRNSNMSFLYIGYQWLLMLMTVLGPGTIIMMIAGAAKLVFSFSLVEAYIFATVPALIFTIVCFWFPSNIQLILAAILSVVYSFIMMIVLVGTIITASTESIFHPSVIVIVLLISIFLIAGFCHPQEIWCLSHGVLYLLTIPSGYLLLVIYSICNLNDVSWGTREVPTKAQRLEMEKKKKEKEEQAKNKPKKGFLTKIFNRGEEQIKELTKLLQTLMPARAAKPNEQLGISSADIDGGAQGNTEIDLLTKIYETLKELVNRGKRGDQDCDLLTDVVVDQPQGGNQQQTSATPQVSSKSVRPKQPVAEETKADPAETAPDEKKKKRKKPRNELKNPLWAEDKGLGGGAVIVGNAEELKFWADFVNKYLLPIRPTPEEKKKIADGLRDLRNSSAFAMIIVNLLWMALNFMFQYTNAARFSIKYGEDSKIEESVLGMGFVFLLLLLLILQMIGMFIHRMGTLQHLLAITEIRFCCKNQEESTSGDTIDREKAIRHIKEVLKIPMTGDVGATTRPPVIAPSTDKVGMTVGRPSVRGILGQDNANSRLMNVLDQTLHNFKSMSSGRPNTSIDLRTQESLNNVRLRLATRAPLERLNQTQDFGMSYRPPLPRPRSGQAYQPMMANNNWGFTLRELEDANVNVVNDDDDDVREVDHMGAMGRSLFQRSKIINETQNVRRNSNSLWDMNDGFLPTATKKFSLTSQLNRIH